MLVYEEFDIDNPIFEEFSDEVYGHILECVVPDATGEEINTIV